MMDIINIVLTCVFLCVMNTGVIFIMDKIRKLAGDNIIHVITTRKRDNVKFEY